MTIEKPDAATVATPAITPSADWIARRAAQMQNIGIVRGGLRGEVKKVAEGFAEAERQRAVIPVVEKTRGCLSPLEGGGWEFEW